MPCYRAYGLIVSSAFDLPELDPAIDAADAEVTVTKGPVEKPTETPSAKGFCARASLQEARLHWETVGTFQIRNGREITVDPVSDQEPALMRSFILGVCMGVLLHQRGLLVLHASAVVVDGAVVAFIGPKGWGKSTTAATLYARGYPLVTDDVLAIEHSETAAPLARPGFAQLKLWPDAAAASLGDDPDDLPRLHSEMEKRVRKLPTASLQHLLPLKSIYVLDAGPELAAERLPPSKAFLELLRHSYAPRFVGAAGTPPWHFHQCTALSQVIPIFSLKRRRDLESLSDIAALVERHDAA